MIFALAAVLGFAIALVRRVSLTTLAQREFAGVWAVLLAAGLHVALSPMVLPDAAARALMIVPSPGLPPLGSMIYLISLTCALIFLWLNRSTPGFPFVLLGLALNFAVIAANGGQMPGDPAQLERAGVLGKQLQEVAAGQWIPFTLIGEQTRLAFLGDVIYFPLFFREPTVISIGDIAIVVGELLFFNLTSRAERAPEPPARDLGRVLAEQGVVLGE